MQDFYLRNLGSIWRTGYWLHFQHERRPWRKHSQCQWRHQCDRHFDSSANSDANASRCQSQHERSFSPTISNKKNRVGEKWVFRKGGSLFELSHHRTYGSAYGGSLIAMQSVMKESTYQNFGYGNSSLVSILSTFPALSSSHIVLLQVYLHCPHTYQHSAIALGSVLPFWQ